MKRVQPAPSVGATPRHLPAGGEDFGASASRLAGQTGAAFGWSPDVFWSATPVELAALVHALTPETETAAGPDDLARLMEAFPDG